MAIGLVKGLWGDHTLRRRNMQPPDAFEAVLAGVREATDAGSHVDAVYCFGGRNKEYLKGLGYEPVKLHDKPWANPTCDKKYNVRFHWNGVLRNGYSYWWHKFKIIHAAFQRFPDGVLWVDFDVKQTKADLGWLYADLANGKDFRASLYVQHNWTWGAGWRHSAEWRVPGTSLSPGDSHAAARVVLGCGFVFFRNRSDVEECLAIQDEFPHFLDHQVVSLWFDRRHGGRWIGHDEYKKRGWHTEGYYYGRQLYPPRFSKIRFQAGERQRRLVL